MKTATAAALLLVALAFPAAASETPPPEKMTILDCYLQLPPNILAVAPAMWLRKCPLIDSKTGYMRCNGEGAQPSFQAVLFHYSDGRPLFILCQGQLNGGIARFLDFFEATPDSRMKRVDRSIFPVEDGDYNKGKKYFFLLLRDGKTIEVRDQKDGKVLHKIVWTGEKFVEEK